MQVQVLFPAPNTEAASDGRFRVFLGVGLSSILDSLVTKELARRRLMKRSHGEIVATVLVGSEPLAKILERVKRMGVI